MTHQHNSVTTNTRNTSLAWSLFRAYHLSEAPPGAEDFIGRAAEIDRLGMLLDAERVALISGLPGVGKSKLGAKLAAHHKTAPPFWHTFRAGLSDTVSSVLWQMALFLARQGHEEVAATLIHEEIFIDEKIKLLAQLLGSTNYLFCFDRIEVIDAEPELQKLLQHLYTALRRRPGATQLIMMSRSIPVFLSLEEWEPLNGFSFEDASAFLNQHSVHLPERLCHELYVHTSGNPRLLEMFIAWFHQAKRTQQDLVKFINTPCVYREIKNYLLDSIDCKIDEDERCLLQLLSTSEGATSYISLRFASARLGIANFESTVANLTRKHAVREVQDAIQVSPLIASFYQRLLLTDMGLSTTLKQILTEKTSSPLPDYNFDKS